MFLKKTLNLRHTLAFRLAVHYTAIFTISSFMAFLVFYFIISSEIQHNRDQHLLENIQEYASILKIKGLSELKNDIIIDAEAHGVADGFFRLFTADGEVFFSSNMATWKNVRVSHTALAHLKNGSTHFFETLEKPGKELKARSVYSLIGPGLVMQIGEKLEEDEEFLRIFRTVFGIVIVLVIPFATCTGWLMGRHALQGVEEVTQTALSISKGGDLEQRVSISTRADEITRLASTFNYMLDRINSLVTGIRDIMDDIAHDLKKPIARIRVIAENNLYTGNRDDHYDTSTARILEECDHLMQMINTILDVSEAESGATKLYMEQIDITEVVLKAYELFHPLAEDKNLKFTIDIPETCHVRGDIHKIQRIIANLLDNALKYTPSGGEVSVSVREDNNKVAIKIKDTGIGISLEDLPHIFERFYRCDKSRSEDGVGLGLTLAKAFAVSHRGDIMVSSTLGKGSIFTIILPV